ncbi:L-histidine N(alpha)-methyltransferase [Rhizobacter sp. Root1221]|uniref:L-histidine N(alpha)-methyltransferase n=1 Tax=Rhizobacter sp. Root1221 TaxID=1736433 RepID=UPI0006F5D3B4|nr:L-histidine N(alpha)-methyltransferase [Rhizobacter sp. Root1221]KQV97556.1 dimethylhistidine N-methyltransferase [Rhizobacter sp. Root1221]
MRATLPLPASERHLGVPPETTEFEREMMAALSAHPRSISPKYFYDTAGSRLFDRICDLPEYYPTRTEFGLLARHGREMTALFGRGADLVEFGAGSVTKVRLLLDAWEHPGRFIPVDISADHLHESAALLHRDYPHLQVLPLAADFTRPLTLPPHPRRVGFFPGSSIGNLGPVDAVRFLRQAFQALQGGGLLIGVDLVKDPARLHLAYNDSAGVTAAFNRNLLVRANRELGAGFDVEAFDHYAFYEPMHQRVEMHLVSRRAQTVSVGGRLFEFAEGESLHTENSHKYTVDGFRQLACRAGFLPGPVWVDPEHLFSVHWLAAPA